MNSIFIESKKNITLKSILTISDDLTFLREIKQSSNLNYNIKIFEKNKFYRLHNKINNFDLIIFDNTNNSLENFVEVFKLIKSYKFNIPIILIDDKKIDNLSLYKYANIYTVLPKSIDGRSLFNIVELAFNFLYSNKKNQLEKSYYFDLTKELLFQDDKIIKLTKTEKKLIKLLSENLNTLITYEQISDVVWENKNFSIFSLRNLVKQIRNKTEESFITNSSKSGYILSTM